MNNSNETPINEVRRKAEKVLPEVIAFLRELIAIPSTSCQEKEVVKRIREQMETCGFASARLDQMGNVIGTMGSGGFQLWYDSHIDTVGVGEASNWPFDPFRGKHEKGIIYGRGASDNKAAMATMVYGAKLAAEMGLLNKVQLTVIGTVQEEDCDGLAMKYALQQAQPTADLVVLGECTNLDIYRGHRGRIELQITVDGKSCHASAPERGINAVYRAAPIVQGIEALNENLTPHEFLGKGSIAVTRIKSVSGSLNTVPEKCEIYLDRRITFGETKETVLEELAQLLPPDGARVEIPRYTRPSHTGFTPDVEKYFPSWLMEEDNPFVQAAVKAAEIVRQEEVKVGKWVFSTNGVASRGMLGIPTIGFGPSEERFAHSIQDQVSEEHLLQAVQFYAMFPQFISGV